MFAFCSCCFWLLWRWRVFGFVVAAGACFFPVVVEFFFFFSFFCVVVRRRVFLAVVPGRYFVAVPARERVLCF